MISTPRAPSAGGSRWSAMSLAALVAVALALIAWGSPAVRSHLAFEAVAFVAVVGCCATLATRLTERLVEAEELDLRLAVALMLFPIVAATMVTLLGAAGLLRLPMLLAALGVSTALTSWSARGPRLTDTIRRALASRPSAGALVALAFFVLVWLLEASRALRYTNQESDSMWYHLPMVAHWLQCGALEINDAIPLIARAYPGLRQAALAAFTAPLGNEHLALLGLVELPMFFLALHVAVRRAGATAPLAMAIACYGASMPVVLQATRSQGTDLPLGACLLLAFVLLRDALASPSTRAALLAGLSLGAASALKYSGPIYACLIVLACVVEFAFTRPRAELMRALRPRLVVSALLAALVVAGPWYGRNLVRFANPFYPAPFLGFDGPLDPAQLAAQTLGWDIGLLLERWRYFPIANGWMAPAMLVAPLVLGVLVALRKRPASANLALVALTLLFFAAFLHQPFNRPSFQPYYNMRYLIGWAALLLVALAAVLRAPAWAWLVLLGAATNLSVISRWAPGLAVASLPLALGFRWLSGPLVRAIDSLAEVRTKLPTACALTVSALAVASAAQLRATLQYDPGYGYRDASSDRGWAEMGAWVHRNLSARAIGIHGDTRIFPYYGDRLDNRIVAFEPDQGPSEAAAATRAEQLDYVVCLTPITGRSAARQFEFGSSLAPALLEQFPSLFVLEREFDGAQLLRVVH